MSRTASRVSPSSHRPLMMRIPLPPRPPLSILSQCNERSPQTTRTIRGVGDALSRRASRYQGTEVPCSILSALDRPADSRVPRVGRRYLITDVSVAASIEGVRRQIGQAFPRKRPPVTRITPKRSRLRRFNLVSLRRCHEQTRRAQTSI